MGDSVGSTSSALYFSLFAGMGSSRVQVLFFKFLSFFRGGLIPHGGVAYQPGQDVCRLSVILFFVVVCSGMVGGFVNYGRNLRLIVSFIVVYNCMVCIMYGTNRLSVFLFVASSCMVEVNKHGPNYQRDCGAGRLSNPKPNSEADKSAKSDQEARDRGREAGGRRADYEVRTVDLTDRNV